VRKTSVLKFLHKFCYCRKTLKVVGGVFENRVLRRIFGPKRREIEGGWRKLHNEELHNLYT
jgi:hypothetical protein